jgi:hypothetical protein
MKMMIISSKKILSITLFLFAPLLLAQENSSREFRGNFNLEVPPEILEYQFNSINSSAEMYKLFLLNSFTEDTSSVWLKTRMMINAYYGEPNVSADSPSKMLNPLYNNFLESQKLAALKSILGAVQVGAAGYLAYKHLKKYGFLKKK